MAHIHYNYIYRKTTYKATERYLGVRLGGRTSNVERPTLEAATAGSHGTPRRGAAAELEVFTSEAWMSQRPNTKYREWIKRISDYELY